MRLDKRILSHIVFWFLAALFLVAFFGNRSNEIGITIRFVLYLIPVAVGISIAFNYWLIPRYLITRRFLPFFIYGFLILNVSIFLLLQILILIFIFEANYSYMNLHNIATDIAKLAVGLYVVVIISTLIYFFRRWSSNPKEDQIEIKFLHVRVDRANRQIDPKEIDFIESMDNYVKIHTFRETMITKEKISHIQDRLPDNFLRIHRSFIINCHKIRSYTREKMIINDTELPISRSYKGTVIDKISRLRLENN